jgi:hypothetical protein
MIVTIWRMPKFVTLPKFVAYMSHSVLNPLCQFLTSQNEIANKINLNYEAMSHNT